MDELDLGPAYGKIGELTVALAQSGDRLTLVYSEIELGLIVTAVYADTGDKVVWIEPSLELNDHIYDMWKTISPEKRWAAMTYTIAKGKFRATFRYPEEVDVEDFDEEREKHAVRSVFGDKAVEYPPPPPD